MSIAHVFIAIAYMVSARRGARLQLLIAEAPANRNCFSLNTIPSVYIQTSDKNE